ncbi:vesicle transport through interaction with t-SNAREs homolog 1B isoform X1 [Hydra vulgaris]|uniref:Vesicle transport through interaction with t-SNAREs homolog 1B n=1 Tax=Hydra vulgaris TaxID=6087 RepID=T2M4B5_HYDVU|nr:vesicle transport through interaction with t-SNAREs homolog 1B [Hydra vulgaris]
MSSEKFEDCEDELRLCLGEIQNSLKNKLPNLKGESKKSELRNIEKGIDNAGVQLSRMQEEAQNAPGAYRISFLSKTRDFEMQLKKCRKELARLTSSDKDTFSGFEDDEPKNAQKKQIIKGFESLDRGTESIVRSQIIAAETDELGVGIISDLDTQREALLRTRDKLEKTDAELGKSRRILASLSVRLATNKLLLVIIIIVELAIIGGIVYLRFFKNKH